MKTYIIYHQVKKGTDCPDGIMAAAIAKMKYPDAILFPDVYKDADEYLELPLFDEYPFCDCRLVIVDFSYPAHWLKHWEISCEITLMDHHAPKFPMLAGFSGAILDADECGATLTWRTFMGDEPMPSVLTHVRRRDIGSDGYYNGLCRESEAITEGLSLLRYQSDNVIETLQHVLAADDCETLQQLGEPVLEARDAVVKAACDRAALGSLNGHQVPFVVLTKAEGKFTSNIGSELCKRYPNNPFAWIITEEGSSSLRSKGFDVSKVAEKYGGGGHPYAAGFKRQISPF